MRLSVEIESKSDNNLQFYRPRNISLAFYLLNTFYLVSIYDLKQALCYNVGLMNIRVSCPDRQLNATK